MHAADFLLSHAMLMAGSKRGKHVSAASGGSSRSVAEVVQRALRTRPAEPASGAAGSEPASGAAGSSSGSIVAAAIARGKRVATAKGKVRANGLM